MTIEKLLEKPYWIIDILPKQVPKDSPGQYFAIKDFFLKEQLSEIKKKHINVILKLNCYKFAAKNPQACLWDESRLKHMEII